MLDTVSRTVRFKKNEADLIDRFLRENPFFDFSSLSRVAVLRFIKDPKLDLRPIDFRSFEGPDVNQTGQEL
jgi:hypothetical protein